MEAAAVVIEHRTGAVRAMVGGWDFDRNKFNRITQARRQVGSAFKPLVYGAALEAGRALPGQAKTIAPPREEEPPPPGASPEYYRASGQTSAQLFEMAAAWDRKTLAGFVEPFAPDVILEGPFGIYRGRKMAVDWARYLQDWNAPYGEGDRKIRVERIVSNNQEAKGSFITAHEWRWEEAGKPVRQTFSTLWRNYDGLWLIAHQKMSEVKPVTDERVRW